MLSDREQLKQSAFSIGPVKNEEELIHILISPLHIDPETREITPSAVSMTDLKKRGYSVERKSHTTKDQILNKIVINYISRSSDRSFVGAAALKAWEIRSIVHEGVPVFEIIDDGQLDHEAHAMIFFRIEHKDDKCLNKRGMRQRIIELLNKHRLNKDELWDLIS